MDLDLVLGMSCRNISCLACDQNSSLAAHTASGVLVLLDTATNCQVRYLHLRQNAVSTVSFSPDGKLIVTGEIGYRPAVRVWRVKVKATDRVIHSHKSIEEFKGNCLKVQDQILFIGFNSGDIHMFDAISLLHLAALPAPTFFQRTCMNGSGVFTLVFNPSTTLLITAYKNSSMCVWDLKEASNVKQKYVAVYHSKAITNTDIFTTKDSKGQVRETLVTVSHDSTVRLWGIVIGESICYDRLSILYTDPAPLQPVLEAQNQTLDNAGIITAVKVSPDRKFIVTGNQAGNICVYDRITFEHSLTVLAHNREVTCLAIYSDSAGRTILASGSRDRLIHIMDVNNDFRLISTLSIHSSSITVVAICEMSGQLNMISCAADRTLSVCTSPVSCDTDSKCAPVLQLSKCTTIMSTPADICVDSFTKQISVGCQDGYIRILDMDLLQERRMFRGCLTEERQILKLCLDSRGVLLLSAASDKTINVISFATGDILISMSGHTKFITGLIFTSR
ncbi:unnamed protein product, partial [Candidula unifasciata]